MSNITLPHTIELPSGAIVMIDRLAPRPTNPSQRGQYRLIERSAWHRVARSLLNDEHAQFEYNEVGAPQIVGSKLNISVSHSRTLVAVIISPIRCAIDIESLTRNFETISSRYISYEEAKINVANINQKALIWSIKEALYKYAGIKEVNLIDDLKVIDINNNRFIASHHPHSANIIGVATTILDHSLAYIG